MGTSDSSTRTRGNVSLEESKKHLARNTLTNLIFIVFNFSTSFAMVPYLIRHLGTANYGMVGLSYFFLSCIQVVTVTFTSTAARFVVFHAAKGETEQARSYMSTQLVTNICIACLALPVISALAYFAPHIVNVPRGQETNTRILFGFVMAGFIVALFSGYYGVTLYVRQRFDMRNIMVISQQIVRYSTWIILFALLGPALWQVGLGLFLEAVTLMVAVGFAFRVLTPELAPHIRNRDRGKFWEMAKFGAWLNVDQVGTMLFLGIDLFVINRMLGFADKDITGKYAAILGITMMLRNSAITMSETIVPMIIAGFAREDTSGLIRYAVRAVRLVSTGLAFPCGILCGLSSPFLMRWLGPHFQPLYVLLWILIAHHFLSTGVLPLSSFTNAAMRVVVPGTATVVFGLIKLALAILLVKYTTLGMYGVAIAGLICFTLRNTLFMPIYTARVLKQPSRKIFAALIPSVVLFAMCAASGLALSHQFQLASYPRLFVAGAGIFIVCGLCAFFFVLGDEDRNLLRRFFPWSKRKTSTGGTANA